MNKRFHAVAISLILVAGGSSTGFSKEPTPAEFENLIDTVSMLRVNARNCEMTFADHAKAEVLNLFVSHGYDAVYIEEQIDKKFAIRANMIGTKCDFEAVELYRKGFFTFYTMMMEKLLE